MSASLSVIVPVKDGERFLQSTLTSLHEYLARRAGETELIVVNDGSTDATSQIAKRFVAAASGAVHVSLLENEQNRGKGYSVRRGLLSARGEYRVFIDADLTYPVENIDAIIDALERGADIAIANRVHPDSRYVMAPAFFRYIYTRHNLGRVFNWLVRNTLVHDIADTQAGLKGFRRRVVRRLLPRVQSERFSFDVELLFLAQDLGLRVTEVPVRFIYEKEPSTVQLARDGALMALDLIRIKSRATRGVYARGSELHSVPDLESDDEQSAGHNSA